MESQTTQHKTASDASDGIHGNDGNNGNGGIDGNDGNEDSVIEIPQHISILELDTTAENTLMDFNDDCDSTITNLKTEGEDNTNKPVTETKTPLKKRMSRVKKVVAIKPVKRRVLSRKSKCRIKLESVPVDNKEEELKKIVKSENCDANKIKIEKNNKVAVKVEDGKPIKAEGGDKSEDNKNTLIITNDEASSGPFKKSDVCEEADEAKKQIESEKDEKRTIWISNINPNTTANTLRLELSNYGKVLSAKIVSNGTTCFGFAVMETSIQARECIERCNKKVIDGHQVSASFETPQKKAPHHQRLEHKPYKSSFNDPLTLHVDKKRRYVSPKKLRRSRSRSRSRYDAYKRNLLRIQHEKMRLFTKKERAKIEIEKKELELEKRELSKLKRQLYEKEKELNERIVHEERKRVSSSKSYKRESEYLKKSRSHVSIHERLGSPKKKSHGLSPRKHYRRENKKSTPPPPKINDAVEVGRSKVDPWEHKKTGVYYSFDPNSKRFFERKDFVTLKDDKGSGYGKSDYQHGLVSRSNWHSQHYSDRHVINPYPGHNDMYNQLPPQNNQWGLKPSYPKTYQHFPATNKPFYQEQHGFIEYDKKHHYLSNGRKF